MAQRVASVLRFIELLLRIGSHPEDGVFAEITNVQAGYRTSKSEYWVDFNLALSSGVGESTHTDIPRRRVDNREIAGSYPLRYEGIEESLPRFPRSTTLITGVASRDGKVSVVTRRCGDAQDIGSYALCVFNADHDLPRPIALDDHFVYQDPIVDVSGGGWPDNTIVPIIDASELNYDFFFDLAVDTSTIQAAGGSSPKGTLTCAKLIG